MTDLLPEHGARSWLPASNVRPVLVLNEYDIPLSGLISQNDTTYLYACMRGELEDLDIWAYAQLTEQEAGKLTSLTDDELGAAVDRCSRTGCSWSRSLRTTSWPTGCALTPGWKARWRWPGALSPAGPPPCPHAGERAGAW